MGRIGVLAFLFELGTEIVVVFDDGLGLLFELLDVFVSSAKLIF